MSTRRWFGELEGWLRRIGKTKEELAEHSEHDTAHVLELFTQPEPNPKLALYLDLVQAAGARFAGVTLNRPRDVIARIKEIIEREEIKSVSALAKAAGINRPQLSSLLNAPEPNPTLSTFDRLVTALGVEKELGLVSLLSEEEAQVVAVGMEEAEAVRQETKVRHLRAVPRPTTAAAAERRNADAERAAEAKKQAVLDEMVDEVNRLHAINVAFEKQVADQQAELDRLRGDNVALERLRAADEAEIARLKRLHGDAQGEVGRLKRLHEDDQAEIARLIATKDWSLGSKVALGLGCFVAGVGAAAYVLRPRPR